MKRLYIGLLLSLVLPAWSGVARADGAFPDSFNVFVPPSLPNQVVLATNFGLMVTNDNGATWSWVCEEAIELLPFQYQMGPSNTFFSVSFFGIKYSQDLCSWYGWENNPNFVPSDLFPDPNDPKHVLALGKLANTSSSVATSSASNATNFLYESKDGAATFAPIFTAPPNARLESVEIAPADSRRIYMTMTQTGTASRVLLSSIDAGAHWSSTNVTAQFGGQLLLIAQVDPDDADTVYFRVVATVLKNGDALAVTHDGGKTLSTLYQLQSPMSCFLRRRVTPSTLIVGTTGGGYISHDSGKTFVVWANSPQLRGIAERGTTLYAAGNNYADGFAVGRSDDEGQTWVPMGRYDQIGAPLSCAPVFTTCNACPVGAPTCESPWVTIAGTLGIAIDAGIKTGTTATSSASPGSSKSIPSKSGCSSVRVHDDWSWDQCAGILLLAVCVLRSKWRC